MQAGDSIALQKVVAAEITPLAANPIFNLFLICHVISVSVVATLSVCAGW
jgi:hypothetical protein